MALTDNLVSYWKLDESSGNAADSVGSNTGTNVGSIAYSAGKINNGATMGSSKRFDCGVTGINITGKQAFTFAMWAKVSSYTSQNMFTYNIEGVNKIQIQPYSGNIYFQRGADYSDVTGITSTEWQFFVITYD
jgi:hypothetical protein